jgi:hypothetical protein
MAGTSGRGGGEAGEVVFFLKPTDEGGGSDTTVGGHDVGEVVTVEEGAAVGVLG